MHVKLRVADGDRSTDVLVDADGDATIGELVSALYPDVARRRDDHGLIVTDVGCARSLSPLLPLGHAGLRSGCEVELAAWGVGDPVEPSIATLEVIAGPDAPATHRLRRGENVVGRDDLADVHLTDVSVSRRHAVIHVDDTIEVEDLRSVNGVVVAGQTVERATLRGGESATLGDTTVRVSLDAAGAQPPSETVRFVRRPHVTPNVVSERLCAPEPPRPPTPHRFPRATVLAPIVLAAALFVVTQSLLSVLFFALSPILMIGSWWEGRTTARRQIATDTERFRAALADLDERLHSANDRELAGRRLEAPSSVELIEAVEDLSALVWCRRPDEARFGRVRLGVARLASSVHVEVPPTRDALPGLADELQSVLARHADIDGLPVVGPIGSSLGIAGPAADAVVNSVLVQLAGLHAPGEVEIVAFAPAGEWAWLAWLPHVSGPFVDAVSASDALTSVAAVVDARRSAQAKTNPAANLPVTVLLAHDDAAVDRAELIRLAERGRAVGVHLIWFAASVDRLPAACRTFVAVDPRSGCGTVGLPDDGVTIDDVRVEHVGAAAAERFARRLSGIVDAATCSDDDSLLPSCTSFLDVVGAAPMLSPTAVADRWHRTGCSSAGLTATFGVTADGPITIDLQRDGPHALVGGTTGSGKSELLQAWLLALAIEHPPERVNFLLVDYKGGAAFADCVRLPHCVGLVTDLRPHLVRRALVALDAEVRRREQLLSDRGAANVIELERRGDVVPSLVIVVDEFAALVAEVPEFVDGVVDIAQRGRSLGLHLVLATQRPAGVVSDHVRANTNLRIALRMADESDAIDVIGVPQPAHVDPGVPGRASVSFGAGRRQVFQAVHVGGRSFGGERQRVRVRPLVGRVVDAGTTRPAEPSGPTDLVRLVGAIRGAASLRGTTTVRRPWLPELADRYRLELLPVAPSDSELVVGVTDDPHRQQQSTCVFRPDVDGNLAFYGAGGSGTSTALRTVALAAAIGTARFGPTWVYGVDLGNHGLEPIGALPHVGAIVSGRDDERIRRLMRFLNDVLEQRGRRFAEASASTIVDFRRLTGEPVERIIVLVDQIAGLRAAYEGGATHSVWEQFVRIASDGRAVGIHVVFSADRPAAVPAALASTTPRSIALRLANDLDAGTLGLPAAIHDQTTPPGRGWDGGRWIQIAVPGGSSDLARQAQVTERLVAEMCPVAPPPPVRVLPAAVALHELPSHVDGLLVVGLDADLGPAGIAPDGVFVVAGDTGSGVSTATATIVAAFARSRAPAEQILLGASRSNLTGCAAWTASAQGCDQVSVLAARLTTDPSRLEGSLVVIESVDELVDSEADAAVQRLVAAVRHVDALVVAAGSTRCLGTRWPLQQTLTASRRGIVLQPDQMDGESLFNVPFDRVRRADFPPGRGVVVDGLRTRVVQLAVAP